MKKKMTLSDSGDPRKLQWSTIDFYLQLRYIIKETGDEN